MKKFSPKGLLIVTAVAAALTAALCAGQDLPALGAGERYRVLSDAFLLPGVLCVGMGLLIFVHNQGGFNIFSYSFRRLFSHLTRNPEFREKYRDYFEYDQDSARPKPPFLNLLLPGACFLVLAAVFNLLFYTV